MSGQKFWRDLIKHKYDSYQVIGIQHSLVGPVAAQLSLRGLSVENENTRRDDEDEDSGPRKLKITHEISGYDRSFYGKSVSATPWWAPPKGGNPTNLF